VVATDLMDLADDRAADALRVAAATLGGRLGLPVVERALAGPGQLVAWRDGFRLLQQVEAWRSDGEWIIWREPAMGPGVAARFARARSTDPDDAERALSVRTDVIRALKSAIGDDGLLVQPAASGPAPPLVTDQADPAAKEDVRVRTLTLTVPAGMAGAPVISLPLAVVDSLPVGLALVGRPDDDDVLVTLAGQDG
jgi:amidase